MRIRLQLYRMAIQIEKSCYFCIEIANVPSLLSGSFQRQTLTNTKESKMYFQEILIQDIKIIMYY